MPSFFDKIATRAVAGQQGYAVPKNSAPMDLRLDGNEGMQPHEALLQHTQGIPADVLRRYPCAAEFEATLASILDVDPNTVIATAGADDALFRACTASLEPGRRLLITTPTFEMIPRYARIVGASIDTVPWEAGTYPTQEIVAKITPETTMIALVTPNNPTGCVLHKDDLLTIAKAAPHALIVIDHAYVEFAHEDLTSCARTIHNTVVVRTMSKAWGLAGLRVGYALAAPVIIHALRAAGNPYAVSGASLHIAKKRLELPVQDAHDFITTARQERDQIIELLKQMGAAPTQSQANFAFARLKDPCSMRDIFASLGIAIRTFPDTPNLAQAVRISCPGNASDMKRVCAAFATLVPDAILFDMDGVLVDVSRSYRTAILKTAAHFGVDATSEDVLAIKRAGDANNDWVVTKRLLAMHDVQVDLEDVTRVFETLYQGTANTPGLFKKERALVDAAYFEPALARGIKLGIVTGRPRRDAMRFLEQHDLVHLFEALVCMDDADAKPSPEPILLAMQKLGAKTAWMIGDTPDDIQAARLATEHHTDTDNVTVAPLGICAPGEQRDDIRNALIHAGAGRVLTSPDALWELLQ